MISKKGSIYIGFVGVFLFFISAFSKEIGICAAYSYSLCLDFSNQFAEILMPFFALLLLSLITYRMREEVYRAWFRFARWYVPIAMLLILITPEYGGGLFNPVQKGSVSFVLTALFFIISLLLIAIQYFRSKKGF